MRRFRSLLPTLVFTLLMAGPTMAAAADAPAAVASIKPVHSLLAGVMEGVGRPHLLVEGGASPHTYSLRPSEAQVLEEADFVVWVGEFLESFLIRPIQALAADAHVLELMRAEGVALLPVRTGGVWDAHDHHDEDATGTRTAMTKTPGTDTAMTRTDTAMTRTRTAMTRTPGTNTSGVKTGTNTTRTSSTTTCGSTP